MANYRKQHNGFVFSLRNVGLPSEAKFYVNENLSQTNFKILREAIRLKKKKNVSFCVHRTVLISYFLTMLCEHLKFFLDLINLFIFYFHIKIKFNKFTNLTNIIFKKFLYRFIYYSTSLC